MKPSSAQCGSASRRLSPAGLSSFQKLHRKMKTLSLFLMAFTTIQTFHSLSAASPFGSNVNSNGNNNNNNQKFLRRFRLGSNLTWTSARAFCLSRESDLCTFEKTCGKFRRPFGGQMKGVHWVPVQDRFNDWVQIGSNQPNSLCLKYTDLSAPPRSPSWGTRALAMAHKGHVFCCARDSKTMARPVFLFKKRPSQIDRGSEGGGAGEGGGGAAAPTTTTNKNDNNNNNNNNEKETYTVRGISTNGCASLCLKDEGETGLKCAKFEYEEELRVCRIHSAKSKVRETEGRQIYEKEDVTFASCGKSGKTGPAYSDCVRSYAGSSTINMLTVEGGIQYWSVPVTGQYRLKIAAPAGRQWIRGVGGYGVIMEGTFRLQQGTIIKILVGQQSDYAGNQRYVGGSGGTFIATINNYPLMVAGGGASSSQMLSANHDITNGHAKGPKGKDASSAYERWGFGGAEGRGGQRGYTASGTGASGGGAGFYGDALCYNNSEISWLVPAKAFTSAEEPGVGEEMYSDIDNAYNNGGFGGGGAAGEGGSGGGGGYSGGGGGPKRGWPGGGGSYNRAHGSAFANNSGLGWVRIRYLGPGSTAEISPPRRKPSPTSDQSASSSSSSSSSSTTPDSIDDEDSARKEEKDEEEKIEIIPEIPHHDSSKANQSASVIPFEEEIVTTTISDEDEGREMRNEIPHSFNNHNNNNHNNNNNHDSTTHSLLPSTDDSNDEGEFRNELQLLLGGKNEQFPYAAPVPTVESILTAQTRDGEPQLGAVYLVALICGLFAVTLFMIVSAVFVRRCYFASKAKYEPPSPELFVDSASSSSTSSSSTKALSDAKMMKSGGRKEGELGCLEEGDYEEPWPDLMDVVMSSSTMKTNDGSTLNRQNHFGGGGGGENGSLHPQNNGIAPCRNAQSSASVRSCDYSTGYTTISTLRSDDAPTATSQAGASPESFVGGHLYCSIAAARTGLPMGEEEEDEDDDVDDQMIPPHSRHDGVMQSSMSDQQRQNVALLSIAAEQDDDDDEDDERRAPSILTTHDSEPDEDEDDDGSYASHSGDDDFDPQEEDDRSDISEEVTSDIDFHSFKHNQNDVRLVHNDDEEYNNDDHEDDDDDEGINESGSEDYAVPQDSVECENKNKSQKARRRKIKRNTDEIKTKDFHTRANNNNNNNTDHGRSLENNIRHIPGPSQRPRRGQALHEQQQQQSKQWASKSNQSRSASSSPKTAKNVVNPSPDAAAAAAAASPESPTSPVVRSKSYIVKSQIAPSARNPNKPRPRRSRSDPRQQQLRQQKQQQQQHQQNQQPCSQCGSSSLQKQSSVSDREEDMAGHKDGVRDQTVTAPAGGLTAFLQRTLPDPPSCPTPPLQQLQQHHQVQQQSPTLFGGYHNNNNNSSSVPSPNFGTMQSIDNSIHYACTDITDIIKNQVNYDESKKFASSASSPSTLDHQQHLHHHHQHHPHSNHHHSLQQQAHAPSPQPSRHQTIGSTPSPSSSPHPSSSSPLNIIPSSPMTTMTTNNHHPNNIPLPQGSMGTGANLLGGGGGGGMGGGAAHGLFHSGVANSMPEQHFQNSLAMPQHSNTTPPPLPPLSHPPLPHPPLLEATGSHHLHPQSNAGMMAPVVQMRRAPPYPQCPLPSPPGKLTESDILSLTTSRHPHPAPPPPPLPHPHPSSGHMTNAREAAALRHSVLTAIENQLSA